MNVLLFLIIIILSTVSCSKNHEGYFGKNGGKAKNKVIIDTDGGVDDAMAILMALADPDLDILAITTVRGNAETKQVVVNVLKTLRVLNSSIPVYPGTEKSLIITPKNDYFYGKDGFGDVPYPYPPKPEDAEKEHAVSAIIRLIRENPNEITIICLGPLTNLAMAIRMDTNLKQNVKNILWIGGSVKGIGNMKPGIEFNAYFDPAANFICFNETGRNIYLAPWECFTDLIQWRKSVLANIKSPQIEFLNKIEEKSLNNSGYWVPADAMTIAMFMNSNVITKAEEYFVDLVWEGENTRGLVLVDYMKISGKSSNAVVIESIDSDIFKDMCMKYLSKLP